MHDEHVEVVPPDAVAAGGSNDRIPDATHFARIAAELHSQPGHPETIQTVLDYAVKGVGASSASVLLLQTRGPALEVVGSTDDVARQADQLQLDLGEGPYLNNTAVVDIDSVLVTQTGDEQRWPGWARAVHDLGIRSVLSAELGTSRHRVGALHLYSDEPNHFDEADIGIARIFAQHAAIALDRSREQANLRRAIDSHRNVGQAEGILMERFDLDGDQAFAVLRRYSQDTNTKLREVAESLIDTRQLPS